VVGWAEWNVELWKEIFFKKLNIIELKTNQCEETEDYNFTGGEIIKKLYIKIDSQREQIQF